MSLTLSIYYPSGGAKRYTDIGSQGMMISHGDRSYWNKMKSLFVIYSVPKGNQKHAERIPLASGSSWWYAAEVSQ